MNMDIVIFIMIAIMLIASIIFQHILNLGGWGVIIMFGLFTIIYNIYLFLEKKQDEENKE